MVSSIRNIERALGTGLKEPSPSEIMNKAVARKSIVASRTIKKGEISKKKTLPLNVQGREYLP